MQPYSFAAAFLAMGSATAASASTIPLKAGDYGDASLGCADQPNAGIVSFDGRNFSYPHATRCSDAVTGRSSSVLTITETCRANGDGSPSSPSTVTFKIRVASPKHFARLGAGGSTSYRRCGALGFFDKQ